MTFVAFTGCDGNSTVPAAPPRAAPNRVPSPPATTPSRSAYQISDVRLVTVRDPVIFWQVSFDASWTGSGAPAEARCRWRMLAADGVAIISGGVGLEQRSVNDEIAASVYPDEISGVPKSAAVDCR